MSAYLIIDITVKDPDVYKSYIEKVPELIQKYGGTYLARGGNVISLAGGWKPERLILIEFESADRVKEFLGSEEYARLSPLREASTESRAVIVEGCG